MKGFRDFVMRGNLVEMAVAFITGAAFGAVVDSFTAMLMDLIGKLFQLPNFSNWNPAGISVGPFLTALVSFLILALVVYFGIMLPFNALNERLKKKENEDKEKEKEEAAKDPTSEELLSEILSELKAQRSNS